MSKTKNITNLRPLRDTVFVQDLDHGAQLTRNGLILLDDNMSERGIHARWAQVHSVGPEVEDLRPGQWVLVEHGRWTNSVTIGEDDAETKVWRIEYPKAVLLCTDEDPRKEIISHLNSKEIPRRVYKD